MQGLLTNVEFQALALNSSVGDASPAVRDLVGGVFEAGAFDRLTSHAA